jgi:hypothetical protein
LSTNAGHTLIWLMIPLFALVIIRACSISQRLITTSSDEVTW